MQTSVWTTAAAVAVGLVIGFSAMRAGPVESPYEHYFGKGKLHKQSISRIEISRGNHVTVLQNPRALKKDRLHAEPLFSDTLDVSSWTLNGRSLPLDEEKVNRILSALVGLRFEVEIPPELVQPDLSLYGLNNPQVALTLFSTEGRESIQFGKRHPGGKTRYAAVSSSPGVVLIPEGFYAAVTIPESEIALPTGD